MDMVRQIMKKLLKLKISSVWVSVLVTLKPSCGTERLIQHAECSEES